jgi:gluconolactonase
VTSSTGFLTHAPGFNDVLGSSPELVKVVSTDAHEGPVYSAVEDALYVTSLPVRSPGGQGPRVAIRRLALHGTQFPVHVDRISTLLRDANAANGMAFDPNGRLVVCEQGGPTTPAGISIVDPATGDRLSRLEASAVGPFNSPNDVVVTRDGAIWFTDPSYGHLQGFRPASTVGDCVYRYDPASAEVTVVVDSLDKPNGLAFSPDETTLYVTDSGANQEAGSYYEDRPHQIVAFDVSDGRVHDSGRVFAVVSPGYPDGIKVDSEGRVYASSASGVQVYDADGLHLGEITLPGAVNFVFGGAGSNVLFITADDAIWAAVLAASAARPQTHPHARELEGA